MHCCPDGHATAVTPPPRSIVTARAEFGEPGSNVTSEPWRATAVHRRADGHEIPTNRALGSRRMRGVPACELGSNVIAPAGPFSVLLPGSREAAAVH